MIQFDLLFQLPKEFCRKKYPRRVTQHDNDRRYEEIAYEIRLFCKRQPDGFFGAEKSYAY